MNRPPELSDTVFESLRDIMYKVSGVFLKESKKNLLVARLYRRILELQITDFSEYLQLIKADSEELNFFINAVTTNETFFFREKEHLSFVSDYLKQNNQGKCNIWSAACSTGEEPYSILIYLKKNNPCVFVRILATDINSTVLTKAKKAVFNDYRLRAVPQKDISSYFDTADEEKQFILKKEFRTGVEFRRHNLLESIEQKFEIIFLRNVLIYFDRESKQKVLDNISRALDSGGILILGKSESLIDIGHEFVPVMHSIYRKK